MTELLPLVIIVYTLIFTIKILVLVLPLIHRYLLRFAWYRGFTSPIKIYFKGIKDVIKECDSMIILLPIFIITFNIAFIIAIIRNLFKGGENKC